MADLFNHFDLVLRAFVWTLWLFVVSGIAALLFGVVIAALRVGPVGFLRGASATFVTLVRNTPLLMIFLFMAVALPRLGFTFNSMQDLFSVHPGSWLELPKWTPLYVDPDGHAGISAFFFRACLALSVYTSTFVAEAIRSGINAVPLGQAEAARAIGLTFAGSMRQVILPQAFRATVPPLASVLIALVKNTSVAAAFGLIEATARMQYFQNRSARDEGIFLTFAIGYVIIVEVVSFGSHRLERRWAVSR